MEHIEDLMFKEGHTGAVFAHDILLEVAWFCERGYNKNVELSVKFDGAPAVFAGLDPQDGKWFVAKKSIFNKVPIVYKSESDIDNHKMDEILRQKMKKLLRCCKPSPMWQRFNERGGNKSVVIHGDLLFTDSMLNLNRVHGQNMATFHPNTILYAASIEDSRRFVDAEIGVIWHTMYEADRSLSNLKGVSDNFHGYDNMFLQEHSPHHKVFYHNPIIEQTNRNECEFVFAELRGIRRVLSEDSFEEFNKIKGLEITKQINNMVRKGAFPLISDLISFGCPRSIAKLFCEMVWVKRHLITMLNRNAEPHWLKKYVVIEGQYVETQHEGYVVRPVYVPKPLKLVDRQRFSFANFSPLYMKGFNR